MFHFRNQAQFFNLFGFFVILCSLNGLQTIATVETMNFRILCFIKNSATSFGLAKSRPNYSLYTISQNKRWRWSASPPSPTNNFDRVDEIQRFLYILLSVTLGAGFIKINKLFQRSLVTGGGGHSTSASAFYSVKLCVMINFSLRHNVLCFSFVVVLYSMYSLYAYITYGSP